MRDRRGEREREEGGARERARAYGGRTRSPRSRCEGGGKGGREREEVDAREGAREREWKGEGKGEERLRVVEESLRGRRRWRVILVSLDF